MNRTLAGFAHDAGGQLHGADSPYSVACIDSRKLASGALFFALHGETIDGHQFVAAAAARGAVGAVVERLLPVALPQVVVPKVTVALQAAASAQRQRFKAPVVAVAGSNGKTTTKELVRAILAQRGVVHATRGNLNNHLGVPMTLLELDSAQVAAVIELGANHSGEVALLTTLARPDVGLVTNAGAEHLEGFGSLEGAARAEGELFAGLAPEATAVLNADDPFAALWLGMNRAGKTLRFGFSPEAEVCILHWQEHRSGVQSFTLRTPSGDIAVTLPLLGRHNAQNAAGAAAAALAAGATHAEVAAGLATAAPVPGRLVMRAGINGSQLLDDTYNANPSSVSAGLQVLASRAGDSWLVFGEMGELGEHAPAAHEAVGHEARAAGVTRLFAIGQPARLTAAAFGAGAEFYNDAASLAASLVLALRNRSPGTALTVYLKGSRVNRLEQVVAMVLDEPSQEGMHAA